MDQVNCTDWLISLFSEYIKGNGSLSRLLMLGITRNSLKWASKEMITISEKKGIYVML